MNLSSRSLPAPVAVPLGGPWTGHTRDTGGVTRSWVTVACSRCHARLWDEPLGMTIPFDSTDHAREELPGFRWALVTLPGDRELALCPPCAGRPAP